MPFLKSLSSRPSPRRLLLATLIPILACAMQWVAWPYLPPLTWLFFYPAAFFGAWIGGCYGGLLATVLSAALAWSFFISHPVSWLLVQQRDLFR